MDFKFVTLCFIFLIDFSQTNFLNYATDKRLKPPASYAVVAPNRVRPNQVVQVYIRIFQLRYPLLNIQTSILRDGEEVVSSRETFHAASNRLTQLKIPEDASPGNYSLLVQGSIDDAMVMTVFRNESKLLFHPRYVSCFVFPDQRWYGRRATVSFRVVAVYPDLTPVKSGPIDVYVKDASGQVVRRWLAQQINQGYYEGSFRTGHPVKTGWWTIEVRGWGYSYHGHVKFFNYHYVRHNNEVIVPPVIYDNEFSIGGVAKSFYILNSRPVKGNATVTLEFDVPGNDVEYPNLKKTYGMIDGEFSFNFAISEVKEVLGDKIADTGVKVHAEVHDWWGMETQSFKGFTTIQSSKYHLRFLGGKIRTFKPGQIFDLHIAFYTKDGSPVRSLVNRMVRIMAITRRTSSSAKKDEFTKIIGEDSMVHLKYQTEFDDEFIRFQVAFSSGSEVGYDEATAFRHYTQGNQYMSITTSTMQPEVDSYVVFTVRTTVFIDIIHYQIVSGGNIVLSSQLFMTAKQKTFSIAASRLMVPEAKIVVWGLLNSGEVIADSLNFHVDGIRANEMKIRINRGKDFSGDTVEINAFTDPSAFTAFSVEQEQLYNLGWNPFFSKEMIEKDLMQYDDHTNTSFSHTWWRNLSKPETVYFPASSYAVDANTTFTFSGLTIITDAGLTRIDGIELCNHTRGYLPCWNGGCYKIEDHCSGVRQCEDGTDELGCDDPMEVRAEPPDVFNNTDVLWKHLDKRTWGWKKYYTQPYGRVDFALDVPTWPHRWLVSGFTLDREKGLSFTEHPVMFDSTRRFYMMMEVPTPCKRGEQIGVQLSIFNTWSQPIDAIILLRDSEDYVFIRVEDNGIVASYNPRTTRGDIQTMVTLRPRESKLLHFPILPLKVGKISVTVDGYTFTNKVTLTKSITVGWEGVKNTYHTPFLIDLVSSGSQVIPFLQIPIPQRFVEPGMRHHRYIPGSGTATVSVIGDVVGTGLYSSHLTAYKTLDGFIHGSGEHYVYNFATNIQWLRFLETTNFLSPSTLETALASANIELQHVFAYIQADGGVAVRRKRPPSDITLTAMTLEHLSRAVKPEWESMLYIDVDILNRIAGWIVRQQNKNTGVFWNPAGVNYDLKMTGNITDENGRDANISITAMAITSLAMAEEYLSGEALLKSTAAIRLGVEYLEKWFPSLVDPFEICICAYAFDVTKANYRSAAFARMREIRREDNYVYWSPKPIAANPVEFVNAIPYQHPRPTPTDYQAKAIQATAYGLMVYLRNNWFEQATPIMKWLNSQRNHFAAFDSTADSLAAQLALSEYGIRETNRHLNSMHIYSDATSSKNWRKTTVLNQMNYLTETRLTVPEAWGAVTCTVEGTGTSLYQMSSSVFVEYASQLRQPQLHAFDLEVEDLVFTGRNSSLMEMNICLRWAATHISPHSGDAILEVDLPSGYFVQKNVLRRYQRVGRIHSQRSRYTKQKVVMHFNYIDDVRSCFYFHAERWYPVANMSIQHGVRIYSAHERGFFNSTIFTTYNLFHQHICQVCGSFQCPYCPFYNQGHSAIHNSCVTFCLIASSVVVWWFSYSH